MPVLRTVIMKERQYKGRSGLSIVDTRNGKMAEIDGLLRLRNELCNRELGEVLLRFLQDAVTSYAVKNPDAKEIKGMCRLIQDLKDIPKEFVGCVV